MIFELTHSDIEAALKAYIAPKGLPTDGMTFVMKTSRKGAKTSRAIITVGEPVTSVAAAIAEPVVVTADVSEEVQPKNLFS